MALYLLSTSYFTTTKLIKSRESKKILYIVVLGSMPLAGRFSTAQVAHDLAFLNLGVNYYVSRDMPEVCMHCGRYINCVLVREFTKDGAWIWAKADVRGSG